MRIGALVSGRGSNLEALLDAGLEVVLAIGNRGGARAMRVAAERGVRTMLLTRSTFADAHARDAAIGEMLEAAGIELTVLAGYDQLLRPGYFAAYRGRTINIHPSLLPRHGGAGMMGMAVHRSVLAAGDVETGVTIHEVTTDLDAGPILAQEPVAVLPGDDADALAARVLAVEHRLLVATVRDLAGRGHEMHARAR
ncbi:MAG TPA: phosphoribosylglycinamide formyltransferase [Candidatus Limnocylindria bacterium]|nr:phosphoribosylglycinamide formyltransferase [Candidatus Limnocylindria bacterium]